MFKQGDLLMDDDGDTLEVIGFNSINSNLVECKWVHFCGDFRVGNISDVYLFPMDKLQMRFTPITKEVLDVIRGNHV